MARKVFEIPAGFEPVPGVPGRWVSRDGLVFSRTGGVIPGSFNSAGYRQVKVRPKGDGQKPSTMLVHRMVAMTFIQPVDGKPYVNHIDRDTTNNVVTNLEWVTASENVRHGRRLKPHSRDKLTARGAATLRRLANSGWSLAKLAEKFNIHQGHAWSVAYYVTHKTKARRAKLKK